MGAPEASMPKPQVWLLGQNVLKGRSGVCAAAPELPVGFTPLESASQQAFALRQMGNLAWYRPYVCHHTRMLPMDAYEFRGHFHPPFESQVKFLLLRSKWWAMSGKASPSALGRLRASAFFSPRTASCIFPNFGARAVVGLGQLAPWL
jgi:hypothetical protein